MHSDRKVTRENNVCPYCGFVPPFADYRTVFWCPVCGHDVDIDEVR